MITSYKQRVKSFWELFCTEEADFRSLIDEGNHTQAFARLRPMLDLISIGSFELNASKTDDSKYELVMSGEGDLTTIFMISYCMAHTPEEISEKWIFHGTRPRLEGDFGIEMHGISLSAEDFLIYPALNKTNKKVDISIYCSKFKGLSEEKKQELMFIYLDSLIGETYTIAYIGKIDLLGSKKIFKKHITLANLYQYIEEIIKENGWEKINDPCEWGCVYEQKSEDTEEVRNDIFIGYSNNMDIIRHFYTNKSWFKEILNTGVSFGFLYYDNTEISTERLAEYRGEFEERVVEALQTINVATLIGGGTGIKNSYIDFIIFDEAEFISLITGLNLTEEKFYYRNFIDGSEIIKIN